jgi:hypothetical protein
MFLAPDNGGGTLAGVKRRGLNEDSMKVPFAFTDLSSNECSGCEETDNMPTVLNEHSNFLTDCLMKVCEERNLPIALKIGKCGKT